MRLAEIAAILVLSAPAAALAQDSSRTLETARLIGYGDSLRATGNGNEALFENPAGIALGSSYSVEAGYLDDLHGSERMFNASIMDSQAGPIAGGISYTYSSRGLGRDEQDRKLSITGHRGELALATKLTDGFALGITGRYLNFSAGAEGSTDEVAGSFSAFTIDAGAQYQAPFGLCLGFAGYNLTNPSAPGPAIAWGAGVGFKSDSFVIEADVRYNARLGKPRFSGAIGYTIGEVVPLRFGGGYDLADESAYLGFGAGFATKELAVDAGYRQRIVDGLANSQDRDDRMFAISARAIFF